MAKMDHENVVRLYGLCMSKTLMLVSQFVPLGALIDHLKKYKDHLNAHTMLTFAYQIAKVGTIPVYSSNCTNSLLSMFAM